MVKRDVSVSIGMRHEVRLKIGELARPGDIQLRNEPTRVIGVTAHWTPVGMVPGADWLSTARISSEKEKAHTRTRAHTPNERGERGNHEINIFFRAFFIF